METEVEQQDPCLRTLTVQIPWEEVEKERSQFVGAAALKTTVPGFRKGHAPAGVINRHFEEEIAEAMLERLAPRFVSEKVRGMDVRLASGPYVTDYRFQEGQAFEIDATIEIFPPFDLGEYQGLKVIHDPQEVTEDVLDDSIDRLRHEHGTVRTLDPRPVEEEDWVTVTMRAAEGEPDLPLGDQQFVCHVSEKSDEFRRPIALALKGLEPGEESEVTCQFPEDYFMPDMAGKAIQCIATVHSIFVRDLPDVDDEFAKDVNQEYESLDDLMEAVRKQAEERAEETARAMTEHSVISALADMHPREFPQRHYRERLERVAAEIAENQELPPEARQLTQSRAIRELKMLCAEQVLDRIADVEDIEISPQEVQETISEIAQQEQMTPERVQEMMESSGLISEIRNGRRRAKAIQVVIDAGLPAEAAEAAAEDSSEQPAEDGKAAAEPDQGQ